MKFKSAKKLATGGITLPGHPHCGPFNDEGGDTTGPLDEACKQHDKEYARLGNEAYYKYNSADSNLLRDSANIPGISSSIVRGVFKAKKYLLPHMTPGNEKSRQGNNDDQERRLAAKPANLQGKRQAASKMANRQDGEQYWYDAREPVNKRPKVEAPIEEEEQITGTSGGGSGIRGTMVIPRPYPTEGKAKFKCFLKGVWWFYFKLHSETNGTFDKFRTWQNGSVVEGTTLPGAGNEMIVHSAVISRQMCALKSRGTLEGYRWRIYGPQGYTAANDLAGLKLLCPTYEMVKFSNWKVQLWPAAAMNRNADKARNMPMMFLDVAREKDSMDKSNNFDYGFQTTGATRNASPLEFPLEDNRTCTRYELGDTFTTIPMNFLQLDNHTTCNEPGFTTNRTVKNMSTTPWWDVTDVSPPTCQSIHTQLHVYDQSIKKDLRAAKYTPSTTGYAAKEDNFICIPYTMSLDVIMGNPH